MGAHYKIRTEKTGHYFTHGTITPSTRFIWVCLHGYGQLAKNFIQKFEFLDPSHHYVIVPEGLNRFYFEGVNERPVASWMTREDRLDEIADYIQFLESLRSKNSWEKNQDAKIIYVGFSQGVTTILRWMQDVAPRVDHLILWAGGLPDDILYEHRKLYFQNIDVHYFIGDKDPYIKVEMVSEKRKLFEDIGLNVKLQTYIGDHRVSEDVLKQWVKENLTL